jgi:protein-L-isoaspartate(D-aspartate) O-methyltransferase
MVGKSGKVIGIEHIDQLVTQSITNVNNWNPSALKENMKLIAGDGRIGYPQEAPYDAIHVGAAASELPQHLIDQLAPGGMLVLPLGTYKFNQNLVRVDKLPDGTIKQTDLMSVIYVPLTDKKKQLGTF